MMNVEMSAEAGAIVRRIGNPVRAHAIAPLAANTATWTTPTTAFRKIAAVGGANAQAGTKALWHPT